MTFEPGNKHGTKFQPGNLANPGGRPKSLLRELTAKYGSRVPELMEALIHIALDDKQKAKDRVSACTAALDRLGCKPTTEIAGSLDVGISPLQAALLDALRMTPRERNARLEQIAAEDDRELAAAAETDGDT